MVVTRKPPLYLQHDGHSRTVVGIVCSKSASAINVVRLVIFDPGIPFSNIWKKVIKITWLKCFVLSCIMDVSTKVMYIHHHVLTLDKHMLMLCNSNMTYHIYQTMCSCIKDDAAQFNII